jgi:hypothetical protein
LRVERSATRELIITELSPNVFEWLITELWRNVSERLIKGAALNVASAERLRRLRRLRRFIILDALKYTVCPDGSDKSTFASSQRSNYNVLLFNNAR